MNPIIHQWKGVGTYHPDPAAGVAWTVNDTGGTIDAGPACDDCGACECETHRHNGATKRIPVCVFMPDIDCVGLSFAFVCLDVGEILCRACFEKAGGIVKDCDCP